MPNKKQTVIIMGSGHLAIQLERTMKKKGYSVRVLSSATFESVELLEQFHSIFDACVDVLRKSSVETTQAIFIVDEEDRRNIQYALAAMEVTETIPIFVALFNESIAINLRRTRPNVFVRNPAALATKLFVDAVNDKSTRTSPFFSKKKEKPIWKQPRTPTDWMFVTVLSFFILFIAASAIFFHWSEQLTWIDSFYFVIVMITTVGFGDITLLESSSLAKLVGIFDIIVAQAFIWTTFSLVINRVLERRSAIAMGRKRHMLKNHIIVCGLGRVGSSIVEMLLDQGEKVLIIEPNPDNRFVDTIRSRGAHVLIGDATLFKNLADAGVKQTKGLISVINNDVRNLEIGLNARSLYPDVRLILRIFDHDFSDELKKRLDIHFAMSTSAIAAEEFVNLMVKKAGKVN